MNTLRAKLLLLSVAIAVLVAPPVAAAEYLVPPGNSAVTQYTESYPTAGGDKDSEKASEDDPSPERALGKRNAKRLEEQGEDGVVVAEVAAETAPSPSVATPPPPAPADEGEKRSDAEQPDRSRAEPEPEVVVSGGSGGAGGGESGSSGLIEVFGQATGSSASGQMGLLLPLAILGSLAWALAFLWRHRHRSMA
jgi:hypothetical protein